MITEFYTEQDLVSVSASQRFADKQFIMAGATKVPNLRFARHRCCDP